MITLSDFWKVLRLYLIPFGGGIPAGVIMGKSLGITWQVTMFIYLVSDIILACIFEPILMLFIFAGKKIPALARFSIAFKEAFKKSIDIFGTSSGPLALIVIAFGTDQMTGRTVAVAAGHGFLTGWLIAITGDMLYFSVIMISTLWLNNVLGDGTWTTWIILALMMGLPYLIRRFRKAY
jgi:hypothetical protein